MQYSDPSETFRIEADDLLIGIENVALDMSDGEVEEESINRLFRAFHTIKGSGAMFGFEDVAGFTHHVESALDRVRSGACQMSDGLIALILESKDEIKLLLEGNDDDAACSRRAAVIEKLQQLNSESKNEATEKVETAGVCEEEDDGEGYYRIVLRPSLEMPSMGMDPLSLLRELSELGECKVRLFTDEVPLLPELNPEACYLYWELDLRSACGLNAVKDVFIFVEDICEVSIDQKNGEGGLKDALGDDSKPELSVGRGKQVKDEGMVEAKKAVSTQATKPDDKDSIVRVPSGKLDRLVNLVGELVMNQSRLNEISSRIKDTELSLPVEAIEGLVDELRDSVLGMRMMPIGSTFFRFRRLVHDLSKELGKEIELVTIGEETEMDKTVLDLLGDPLVHLIRNSIDHGIESPDTRENKNKGRCGNIVLEASHDGPHVVVSIRDDGKGIDVEKVKEKAIERGLIQGDEKLADEEVFGMIFEPGFSTASAVTNVSGRGVGMDVVKRQIDALRGRIEVHSQPGQGTEVKLTLPLTLAIIDGLLVEISGNPFIIPMAVVAENVELGAQQRCGSNGRNVIVLRGELIPYIVLRDLFRIPGRRHDLEKVVLVRHGSERVGLVVDRVLGSHQTVIQSLGHFYRNVHVSSGSTIMGNGRVALILDVAGLVRHAEDCKNEEGVA